MNTKKILSALVAGTMAFSAMGFTVMAEEVSASTADEFYSAVDTAQSGDVINLTADVTYDVWNSIWNKSDLTINGNGNTITVNAVDSGINGGGLFIDAENLTINDLTVNLPEPTTEQPRLAIMKSGALNNVTVIGGTYGVSVKGDVTITDCTFEGLSGWAVETESAPGTAVLTIADCTFDENAVILRGENNTFTGNTITGTGESVNVLGDAVITGNDFGESTLGIDRGVTVTVENNTINNVELSTWLDGDYSDVTVENNTLSAEALEELATEISEVEANNTVVSAVVEVATYEDLAAALEAGSNVKLTADITATGAVNVVGKTVDIDLNGKTLTVTKQNNFNSDADVTIKNGDICITGAVADGDALFCVGNYSTTATVTLENVDVYGDGYNSAYAIFYVYGTSTLNINGGSVVVANEQHAAGGVFKAESAANGKINITGTADDPVELAFTDANIGFLDGTVVMDYVDLDITGGANAINQSALTVKNSTLTIKDCDGRALTLKDGDVVVENSTLDFSGATEGEIRFKAGVTLSADETSNITACDIYADASATGAKVNDEAVTGTEAEPNVVTVTNGEVTVATTASVAEVNGVGYETIDAALAAVKAGETVTIYAGSYTTTATSFTLPDNVTIIGEGEVTINNKLGLSAKGVTVKNINVVNPGGDAFTISGNGTIEDCELTGTNGARYCYANNGDVTFKNCVITGDVYGVHFDAGTGVGNVILDGCTVTGWTSFGTAIEKVEMTNTEFKTGNYNYIRFYQDATVSGCTFNADMAIDIADSVSAEVAVTDSTVADGSSVAELFDNHDVTNGDVTVDGDLLNVEATKIDVNLASATTNTDAVGYYAEGLALKDSYTWTITMDDAKKLGKDVSYGTLSGEGTAVIGIVITGMNGSYATSNISAVAVK